MQRRSIAFASVRFYDDLHILIQRYQKAQQSLDGKLPELTTQHLRNIGLPNAQQAGGLNLLQPTAFHDRANFEDELRLD